MDRIDEEYNMTSASTRVKIQDLPFNNQVDPLYISDPEVTKLQKAMKQFPQGTEMDLESSIKSDSRILAIHNGARRLRYLCIPHTPYNKCIMYNRTIGVNSPLTTPPDDACVFLWQPCSPGKLWVLPAHRCDWNEYNPSQWHALVFSQNRMSFKEAPTIRPMPIDHQGDHDDGGNDDDDDLPSDQPDQEMQQAPQPDPPAPPDVPMPQATPVPAQQPVIQGVHPDAPVQQPRQPQPSSATQPISSTGRLNRLG